MSRLRIGTRSIVLLLLFSLALLGARPLAVHAAAPQPAAPAAAAAGKSGLVAQAFNAIVTNYFNPVSTPDLLHAGWTAATSKAAAAGNNAPPAEPDFSGDAPAALDRFLTAYQLLEGATLVDQTDLAYASIRGMVSYIGNCHTYFLTPTQAATQRASLRGQDLIGAGLTRTQKRPWLITYVVPGGPADTAGLKAGDSIYAYDGDPSDDAPVVHGAKALGDILVYTIQRPGEAAPRDVSVAIGSFRYPRLESRIVGGNVGYMRFFTWESGTAQASAIRAAVASFQQQGVTSWIVDVRSNGGGYPISIADLFLPAGVPVSEQMYRSGRADTFTADGNSLNPLLPLVVLIGRGSGSASEIVPEALHEAGYATLIGEHTEGCMAGTSEQRLADGSSIWVTTVHELVGTSHFDFEGIGVTPDIVAPQSGDDLAAGRDPGLDAAIAYLHNLAAH